MRGRGKKRRRIVLTAMMMLPLFAVHCVNAQMASSSFVMKASVLDDGGGNRSSVHFEARDALGQAAGRGILQSASYEMYAGFMVGATGVERASMGDVNADAFCNSTDALIILSYDVGLPVPDVFQDKIERGCADLNADGYTNSTDALILLSYDVGLSVPFCVCECSCPSTVASLVKVTSVEGAKAAFGAAKYRCVQGSTLMVPVVVDMSRTSERLGSLSGHMNWDPQVLRFVGYSGGKADGFAGPVVNEDEAAKGALSFADACAEGAINEVDVINVSFEVIGSEGVSTEIEVDFDAMTAAKSFNDLRAGMSAEGAKVTVVGLPRDFSLEQNYPNPFNPTTTISYSLPVQSRKYKVEREGEGTLNCEPYTFYVTLRIFNVMGQEMATLVDQTQGPGVYTVVWDGRDEQGNDAPSGVYFCRLQADKVAQTNRMLLLR